MNYHLITIWEWIRLKRLIDNNSAKQINVTTPKNIQIISKSFVSSYPRMKKITITENIEKIEAEAFKDLFSLKKVYFVNNSKIEIIPKGCFQNCKNLEIIILPMTLVTISFKAFKNCNALKSLIIPNSVKIISEDAFADWQSDQSVITFKDYEILNDFSGKIIRKDAKEEHKYKINKDSPNRYFAVTCRCGHVGRDRYIPITFAVIASSAKEASKKASSFPRVKENHKYRIIQNKEVDYQTFLEIKKTNDEDPYLKIKTKSEQRKIQEEIDKRTKKEDHNTKNKKHLSSIKVYDKNKRIRNLRKWKLNHPQEKKGEKI